jgi:glycerophosphoryl diester phosphodiesterase
MLVFVFFCCCAALDSCWTSVDSRSALIVSHGGAWDLANPYDSMGAYKRAFDLGSDAVKGDYRVSKDGFGMVVHSSPFQWYESLNCRGDRVEQMSAFEVSHKCDMYFTSWKFLNVSDLLAYTNNKMMTMFDVKNSPADLPHAMNTLLSHGAENRTFLEVSPQDILSIVHLPHFRSISFLVCFGFLSMVSLKQTNRRTHGQWKTLR